MSSPRYIADALVLHGEVALYRGERDRAAALYRDGLAQAVQYGHGVVEALDGLIVLLATGPQKSGSLRAARLAAATDMLHARMDDRRLAGDQQTIDRALATAAAAHDPAT